MSGSEAALPPTATASAASGMTAPSKASRARARIRARSISLGGSARHAAWSELEPTGNDCAQSTPSASVPTAISVEPPPTSTTASVPRGGGSSVRAAPWKASRASSSPLRISASTPARSRSARTSSAPLAARRIAAVATTRMRSQPHSRAVARCSATTFATASIVAVGDRAELVEAAPDAGECAQLHDLGEPTGPGSATSSRVVFDPMSMQAQRMGRR